MLVLIFCGDIKYCPYIQRYIERIKKKKQEYLVLFWNRSGFDNEYPKEYKFFREKSDLRNSKIRKLRDFHRFRKWIKNELKIIQPEKLIILSTLTGVLLANVLTKYKRKYIFDIRDYSYEHLIPFYALEKKVIYNSYFTAISSNGFKAFLPENDYVIAHNFSRSDLKNRNQCHNKQEIKQGKIHFVWNGVIRYFDYQKQFIDALKNDDRFEMIYYGDGPELLKYKEYCEENRINNIYFMGSYDSSEKWKIMDDADVLNNCYGYINNPGNKLKYAVSNKFYDGLVFHIPQVVENNGYKSELVKKWDVGFVEGSIDGFADKLFQYYMNYDRVLFSKNCDVAISKVLKEDDFYIERIEDFLNL